MSEVKNIQHHLASSSNSEMSQIFEKLALLKNLDKILKTLLPIELAKCCRVINFREMCLVIETTSSAATTKARFYEADLLSQWQSLPDIPKLTRFEWIMTQYK